jgi:hypothetical protein
MRKVSAGGLCIFLTFLVPAYASPIEDAKAAIQAGRYEQAAAILLQLVEQGDSQAESELNMLAARQGL